MIDGTVFRSKRSTQWTGGCREGIRRSKRYSCRELGDSPLKMKMKKLQLLWQIQHPSIKSPTKECIGRSEVIREGKETRRVKGGK